MLLIVSYSGYLLTLPLGSVHTFTSISPYCVLTFFNFSWKNCSLHCTTSYSYCRCFLKYDIFHSRNIFLAAYYNKLICRSVLFHIYRKKCTSLAPALYRRSIVYPNISDEQSSISVSSLYIKSAFSSKLSLLLSISIALNTPGSSYSLLPAPYPVFFIVKCCGSAVSVLTAATIAAPVALQVRL